MNRTLVRRTALAAAIVLGLLVVGAAIFTATFDVNRYKPQIVAAVKERTGRTLAFDGDLSLGLIPRIAVKLPATTLSEPGRETIFARLESAQASVALLPLLRRQIEVDGVRIDGLQATVVRQKDGSTNIDDLIGRQAATPAGKGGPAAAPSGAGATIGAVELRRADVTWRDLQGGRTLRLTGFDLRAGRYAPGARMPIDARAAVTSSDPALTATVAFKAEVEWTGEGGVGAVRDLSLKGEGQLKQQPVAIDAKADALVAGADAVDVRGLKVSATGKGENGAPMELQFVAPRLEAGPARAAGERIELTAARRGTEPLDVRLVVAGVRGNASRLEATDARISGSLRAGARTTRFDLASPVTASVNDRAARIERATGEVVVEDPALGARPVRLPLTASAAIDGRRETAALQFDVRGDGLSARGKLDVAGVSPMRIGFDVDAEQIDADRYFLSPAPQASAAGGAKGGAAPAGAAGAPADSKVDFTALRGLDAAGNLRIARLRIKGTDVADVRAAIKANDGRLDVAPFSLRAHGGSVSGSAGVDARANRVALKGTLAGIQLRSLVSNIGGRAALEGSASGNFDLAAAGATVSAMKRALGGTLALDVRDGALVGIDLADLLGTASNFLQSRGRQTGALDEKKRTPFSQLSASVRVKDGVATNDDLKAKSPQLDITGRGRMDLVSTELDYALQAGVLPGPATEASALRSLAGMTVPVKITGPVEHPSYAVDWAPIAAELLLKRATGRAGSPSSQQLLEGLGDLLRRRK